MEMTNHKPDYYANNEYPEHRILTGEGLAFYPAVSRINHRDSNKCASQAARVLRGTGEQHPQQNKVAENPVSSGI